MIYCTLTLGDDGVYRCDCGKSARNANTKRGPCRLAPNTNRVKRVDITEPTRAARIDQRAEQFAAVHAVLTVADKIERCGECVSFDASAPACNRCGCSSRRKIVYQQMLTGDIQTIPRGCKWLD